MSTGCPGTGWPDNTRDVQLHSSVRYALVISGVSTPDTGWGVLTRRERREFECIWGVLRFSSKLGVCVEKRWPTELRALPFGEGAAVLHLKPASAGLWLEA